MPRRNNRGTLRNNNMANPVETKGNDFILCNTSSYVHLFMTLGLQFHQFQTEIKPSEESKALLG